jgi:hypothetical protein
MAPALYYDSNTLAGVTVDGVPDAVADSPLVAWSEIAGARGGLVTILDVTVDEGMVSNYYLDDSSVDADDTGDQRSYADAGARIDDPAGFITVSQAVYITLPSASSQGNQIQNWYDNPLQVTATAQTLGGGVSVYMPFVRRQTE